MTSSPSRTVPPTSDVDIVFISSDRVRYGIHSKNLEASTGGFPPVRSQSGLSVTSEPVPLTESSSVLNLLFRFIYPMDRPKVEDMEFKIVIELAEAAEKYQVFSAVHVCRLCLRYSGNFIMKHPVEIALFAAKHGYPDLLELTRAHGALLPLSTVVALLPQHLVLPWIKYREKWEEVYREVPDMFGQKCHSSRSISSYGSASFVPDYLPRTKPSNYQNTPCDVWRRVLQIILSNYHQKGLLALVDIDGLFTLPAQLSEESRGCCTIALKAVRTDLEKRIQNLTPFSKFLTGAY
ncbi:hypothetical protein MD484_g1609, partial [Candolleomyces efflorescens]